MSDILMGGCPFCGSEGNKVEVRKETRYRPNGGQMIPHWKVDISVVCNRCGARSGSATGLVVKRDKIDYPTMKWATPEDDIRRRAINKWNMRSR